MKIIKKGQLPEERVYVGECDNCHTVMEAKQSELRYNAWRNEGCYFANCMLCNSSVSFRLKPPSVDYDDPRESFANYMEH